MPWSSWSRPSTPLGHRWLIGVAGHGLTACCPRHPSAAMCYQLVKALWRIATTQRRSGIWMMRKFDGVSRYPCRVYCNGLELLTSCFPAERNLRDEEVDWSLRSSTALRKEAA